MYRSLFTKRKKPTKSNCSHATVHQKIANIVHHQKNIVKFHQYLHYVTLISYAIKMVVGLTKAFCRDGLRLPKSLLSLHKTNLHQSL